MFPVFLMCEVLIKLYITELPYGWEKIDDPHYGTYYIE